jgi:predicted kinase
VEKELVIIIGNIGSGKTTKAKEYINRGYIHIARDGIRYMLGGGDYIYNQDLEPLVFEIEFYIFKRFVDFGMNIVVDEANVSKEMRKDYIDYARLNGYKIVGIEMPRYDRETCVKRRMNDPHGKFDDRKTWEFAWDYFDSKYEEMEFEEGFDQIIDGEIYD